MTSSLPRRDGSEGEVWQEIAKLIDEMRSEARQWRGRDPINNRTARQLEKYADKLQAAAPVRDVARLRGEPTPIEDVARRFIAYYSREGGCSNCGGLPHTTTCFVGLFQKALAAPSGAGGRGAATQGPVDLSRLRALLEKCTPLPWGLECEGGDRFFTCEADVAEYRGLLADAEGFSDENARLIVAAVNALPFLLDRLAPADAEAGRREALEARLTAQVCKRARDVFDAALENWVDTDETSRLPMREWDARRVDHAANAMRAVLTAALSGAPHGDGQAGTAEE